MVRLPVSNTFLYSTLLFSEGSSNLTSWKATGPSPPCFILFGCQQMSRSDVHRGKTEEDSRYIWWSFYFFIAVVAYIAACSQQHAFLILFDGINQGPSNQTHPKKCVSTKIGPRVVIVSPYNAIHQLIFRSWSRWTGVFFWLCMIWIPRKFPENKTGIKIRTTWVANNTCGNPKIRDVRIC